MHESPQLQRPLARGLSPQQRRLLSRVSRSFDLSIRLLPRALQDPVAIGYLLARATDTVADTHTLPLAERQNLLDLLSQTLNQDPPNVETTRECARLTHHFAQPVSYTHLTLPTKRIV